METFAPAPWTTDLREGVRRFPRACVNAVLCVPILAAATGAFCAALLMGWLLRAQCGDSSGTQPYHQILGSIILNVLLLCVWLSLLPHQVTPWGATRAWLRGTLLAASAYAGLYLCGSESAQTFLPLWLLTIAQGGLVCAIASVSSVICMNQSLGRQLAALVLAFAVTALFWSRTPIQSAPQTRPGEKTSPSDLYYDAVLKLSPPVAISSVWYQQSDVSRRKISREGANFDIIRAQNTYEIWMGSYTVLPYPAIYPSTVVEDEMTHFNPGLILSMLVWGLPVLLLCDVLLFLRQRRSQAAI